MRGFNYFRDGRVRLLEGSAEAVQAKVRGTRSYEVSLLLSEDGPAVRCSCPHFAREEEACKHVWATLLAAESAGHLGAWSGETALAPAAFDDEEMDLDSDDLDDQEDPDDFDDEDPGDFPEEGWSPRRRQRPRRRTAGGPVQAPKPGWKQILHARDDEARGRQRPEPWPPGKEILYVIDAVATLQTGRLAVELAARSRKQNGEWSKPAPARIAPGQIPELPERNDREILTLLRGGQGPEYGWHPSYEDNYARALGTFHLPWLLASTLVPRMCDTGRCRLRERPAGITSKMPPWAVARREAAERPLHVLAWDEGAPWELRLGVRRDEGRGCYLVTGELARGEERMSLAEPWLLLSGGFVFASEKAARLEDFGAFRWAALLREHPEIEVPLGDAEALLQTLLDSPALPRLELPAELSFEEVRVAPRPGLSLRRPTGRGQAPERIEAELSFDYDGRVVSERDVRTAVFDPEQRRRYPRDREAERTANERLVLLGFRHARTWPNPEPTRQLTPRHLPRAVQALIAEGWRVEAEGKLYRAPGTFRIEVVSGIDWFDLQATVDYGDETASLPELLASLRRGETMVRLGDGSFGLLPEEWLRRCAPLAGLGTASGEAVRFRRSQTALLDALLAAEPEATFDAGFAAARKELQRFEGIDPADPPGSFRGELRPYQRDGLGWFGFLERFGFGGCLADDMGLGKTVQVLAMLEARRASREPGRRNGPRPSLVVAPRSVIFNWKAEAERFAPALSVLDHSGTDRSRDAARFDEFDLVLTTYGTLRRDAAHLHEARFDWVILDESQAIKNASSASAKAAKLLRGEHRLALSGTPVENHLGELWSLFDFLNPGMLGSATVFRALTGSTSVDGEGRALLAKALRPLLLRRTKGQVAKDLPARTEQTIVTELDRAQRRFYDELRNHYRRSLARRIEREGLARAKIQVLEALLRLRQAACHPGLVDSKRAAEPCAKLEALLPTLEETAAEGHKALVFSQFTSFLAIVRERLDRAGIVYEYLDGRTRDRAARVGRFQNDPGCPVFLVSLKAGGLGLNLTAAEYVFLLDPWWNPAVEAQAIDRTHRIGQTRQVFAYRLIARDTVEEKVLELQRSKRELAEAIFGDESRLLRELTREDLELLLS